VPADDGLRPDDEEVPAPVVSGEASEQPEQLVAGAQPRTRARGPREDRELVAQQEVLRHEVAAVADGRAEQRDEQQQALDHRRHDRRHRAQTDGPTSRPRQVD
jgi:hypothetical protein